MPDTFICLLRAVNVGGRKLIMADLRAAAVKAGIADFRTYIQSGNLIFSADGTEAEAEAAIEALVEEASGLKAIAIVRSAARFAQIAAANPFPEAASNMLHLCLTKFPPNADAAERMAPRALGGERVAVTDSAIWIDFAGGVGTSKLTPATLDKAAGSTLTARNWNTVRKLVEMAFE